VDALCLFLTPIKTNNLNCSIMNCFYKQLPLIVLSLLGFTAQGQTTILLLNNTTEGSAGVTGTWTVPAGGPYQIRITSKGGKGGTANQGATYQGGQGAVMMGEFIVHSGEILEAVAGAAGQNYPYAGGGGGGGGAGSGVRIQGGSVLIIAGGGGGAGVAFTGQNGLTNPSGGNGSGGTGNNGAGGSGLNSQGGASSEGTGAGGQGYNAAGGGTRTCSGGGGYGGDGGPLSGSGGGGGYTGGAGGIQNNGYPTAGGGGGSYNTGTNQTNVLPLIIQVVKS
jgi:hypothetical protein